MPKKRKDVAPDYASMTRGKIPHEFQWQVKDIFTGMEAWEKEKKRLLKKVEQLKGIAPGWTSSPEKMSSFLILLEEVEKSEMRLHTYVSLMSDTDMGNSVFQSKKGEIHTLAVNIASMITFIEPDILKLGKNKLDSFIKACPKLGEYRFKFDSILRLKKHILPADKAEIIAQTGLFSSAPGKAAGILNDLDIPSPEIVLSDGKKVQLNTAYYNLYRDSDNREDRHLVMKTFWQNRAGFKTTLAVLQDAAIKSHFFYSRTHHYKSCLSASLYPKNINLEVYHNLVETVKKNLRPLFRYLQLKGRLLKLKEIRYADLYASSVPATEQKYTFTETRDIIMAALEPLGGAYCDMINKAFKDKWIDIYPNKGKRSGAYSQGSLYDVHPYILMNYNGSFRSLTTMAHELGHAMHSWFSNHHQPFALAHYPIFLAEIASTLNENLLIDFLKKNETKDRYVLYILDQYLEGFRGTLFRQTLFSDFELQMHQEVEKGKTLTHDWLDEKYLTLTRKYYGHGEGILQVEKYIENEWSGIPHFYYNFYVYQYATGIIASMALSEMLLNGGNKEQARVLTFLKSGGSKYPLEILKRAGVDLANPKTIQLALSKFGSLVNEMEQIAKPFSNDSPK